MALAHGGGLMAKRSNRDDSGRAGSQAAVHPHVLRFDDDTDLNIAHRVSEAVAAHDDPEVTREIEDILPSAAHTPPRLPAELVLNYAGALESASAEITDLSRSAVFVATAERPAVGSSVHIRVHSRFGVGTALGTVESHLSGAGFIVRLTGTSLMFTEFADEIRAYAEGRGRGDPPLLGPIELHVL